MSKKKKPAKAVVAKNKRAARKRSRGEALPLGLRDAIDFQRLHLLRGSAVLESVVATLRRDNDDMDLKTIAEALQLVIDTMRNVRQALMARNL